MRLGIVLVVLGGMLLGFGLRGLLHRESPVLRLAPGDSVLRAAPSSLMALTDPHLKPDTVYIICLVGPDSIMRVGRWRGR